jgi:hypothetical protein
MWPPALPVVGVWEPQQPLATYGGGIMQPQGLEMMEGETSWSGVIVDEALFSDVPTLNSEIDENNDHNVVEHSKIGEVDDDIQEETVNDTTWNLVDEVIGHREDYPNKDNIGERRKLEEYVPKETCRVGPCTPPGSPVKEEVKIEEMWVTASSLARALAMYAGQPMSDINNKPETVTVDRVNDGASTSAEVWPECCQRGTCVTPAQESPSSPDRDSHSSREWRSESSEDESVMKPYQPKVSPVSSDMGCGKKLIPKEKMKQKGYWKRGVGVRRVAHVRPQTVQDRRRADLNRRRMAVVPTFRVRTQAPVVQTADVVSRVTSLDGDVMEESLRIRFALARDMALQTLITMDMLARALGENWPGTRSLLPAEGLVNGDGEAVPPEAENVPEVGIVIDLTEATSDNDESAGTPVQDEPLP